MGNKQSYNLTEGNVQAVKANNNVVNSEIAFTYDTAQGIKMKSASETKVTVIPPEPPVAAPEPEREETPVFVLRRIQPMPHLPLPAPEPAVEPQVPLEVTASG